MRILFYGGCHAQALRVMFARFGFPSEHLDTLINFKLIADGSPLPWEWIADFDLVVYSPILNTTGYGTEALETFCATRGVRTLRFPWLEWHGYHPGCVKCDVSPGRPGWEYPALREAARTACSPVALRDQTFAGGPAPFDDDAWIRNALAATSARLAADEAAGQVDIRVSDFIAANHQKVRLFMTPNHPTGALYRWLALQIAERAGLTLDPAIAFSTFEPQPEEKLPILPAVHRALGLAFADAECRHDHGFGAGVAISMSEYLALHWHLEHGDTVLVSAADTFLKRTRVAADRLSREDKWFVHPGQVLGGSAATPEADHMRLLTPRLDGRPIMAEEGVYIYTHHWRRAR